ncbi:protein FAM200C-like [Oratosquilla oratoria]|uniref:protein FAM200C-like n=1 Tax=Oratosquilla oratoria TaxID=337810 RepID=UPI003F76C34A
MERDGSQRPQCMICNANLSNSSLAPAKLREHFLKLHGDGEYKNTTFAEFKVKRARFDEKGTLHVLGFVPIDKPVLTASYEVAYLITKQDKPHTIGETLVKPAALKVANIMLGKVVENKLSQIPLSNDTISSRIDDMSNDILAQVIADPISSPAKFSLQLNETTNVSSLSQLAVFVRYVKDDIIKEEFLFCKPLTTTTKAADVKKFVDDFFRDNDLSWDMVSAVCSDGAPVMLGRKSGFSALVKADTHCYTLCSAQACIGSKNLASKTRTKNDNFANFPLLDDCGSKIEDESGIGDISVPGELKQAIALYLDELAKSLDGYFPTRESYPAWVRQPFTFSVATADVNVEYLDEIIQLQQIQVQQQLFRTTTLSTFWCHQIVAYPLIAKKALEILIPRGFLLLISDRRSSASGLGRLCGGSGRELIDLVAWPLRAGVEIGFASNTLHRPVPGHFTVKFLSSQDVPKKKGWGLVAKFVKLFSSVSTLHYGIQKVFYTD